MGMVFMAACGLLVLIGVLGVVRWGGAQVRLPDLELPSDRPAPGLIVRCYVWYLTLAVVSGVGSGILIAGPGGRLAMRLLAATADDAAQGRLTEAEEASAASPPAARSASSCSPRCSSAPPVEPSTS